MSLFKDNFYTVVKLWINQFGAIFLGFSVLLPTAKNNLLRLIASGFVSVFYLVLIFWVCCEVGLQDCVPIETGRMKRKWYKGALLSLTANSIALLSAIVSCIAKLCISGVPFFASAAGASGTAASVYTVSLLINEGFLHVMYKGLLVGTPFEKTPVTYLPIILLSVAVCTVGYLAGTKGFLASLLSRNPEEKR